MPVDFVALLENYQPEIDAICDGVFLLFTAAAGIYISFLVWKCFKVATAIPLDEDLPSDDPLPVSEWEEMQGEELEDYIRLENGEITGDEWYEKWHSPAND